MAPANVGNMIPNTVYTVEVAYFAGQWEAYGAACYVITGGTIPRYSPFNSESWQEAAAVLGLICAVSTAELTIIKSSNTVNLITEGFNFRSCCC